MAIKDYLVVDMAKPANTFVNLTDYFQGRVGDAEAYCKLWIKFGSRPIDMTDKKLRFEGNDPNGTPFIDAGRFDAGDDGDVQLGMITFYFPKGFFQVEGKWQHAFFKLQTNDGKDISTADLTLNVLPNNVEMGIGIHPFESDLEKTKAQINQALREMNAQQLLNQIESMKTTVGAYTDLITRNQVLNKPQVEELVNDKFNSFSTTMNGKFTSLQGNVNSQLVGFQKTLNEREWVSTGYSATMLNGADGWVLGQLAYNDKFGVGRIQGFVKLPAGRFEIDFATNPLHNIVDLSNNVSQPSVLCDPQSDWKNGRIDGRVGLDQNQTTLGMWGGTKTADKDTGYDFFLNMVFQFPRSAIKL